MFAAGRNNITRNAAGCYMASQICGGVFASFIYSSVTSGAAFDLGPYGKHYYLNAPMEYTTSLRPLLYTLLA